MKLVIETRLDDDASTASADRPVMLAVIERKDHDLTDFGLSLAGDQQGVLDTPPSSTSASNAGSSIFEGTCVIGTPFALSCATTSGKRRFG